ncbi:NnrU family protein [Seohaeicola zhoushanensis]|uniref:Membrane protein n=1 Tax=Seohaeicola zhoushanensis TaxID=1569283 RepID=A0A8J3GU78_9RHOB|nr:NnrU family protein [Seohaeicola zhoushanensis]GHF38176.1 membrane protein [Seohaeicola zhoushanensis]
MGFILLIIGIALWFAAHLFKRLAPARRAAMGDKGRGPVALALLVSLVLIVLGYRWADMVHVWFPPVWLWHVNNLLMLLAVWTFGASEIRGGKVWPATRIRHPQLTAVKTWALAHLLVNGDLASILLFGAMLAWAVVEVIVINRAEPAWTPPPKAPARKLVVLAVITLVVYAVIVGIHLWLGVRPFPS